MAKKQSKLRDAVDAVFAPAQYLTHDGAVYSPGKYMQAFNRATKLEYPVTAGIIMLMTMDNLMLSSIFSAAMIASTMLTNSFIDLGSRGSVPWKTAESLDGYYFDTNAEAKVFIEPKLASKLKKIRNTAAFLAVAASAGGASLSFAVISNAMSENFGPLNSENIYELASIWAASCGFVIKYEGDLWRAQQVLDGNWSLIDNPPNKREQSSIGQEMIPGEM